MHLILSMEIGGTQTRLAYLANALGKEKFDFSICCLERIGNINYRIDEKVKIFLMNKKPGKAFLLPFKLFKLFKQEKIDIVHTHDFPTLFYGVIGAVLARTPVVIHGEMGDIFEESRRRHYLVVRRLLSFFVNRIVANSNGLKGFVKELTGIKESKFKIIYNGVDVENFKRPAASEDDSRGEKNDIIIGSASRLIDHKNQQMLIKAIPLVKEEIGCIKVVIIGDGPSRPKLEAMASDLRVERYIQFLGARTDVSKLLGTLDIFVFPSLAEGCPNAILEAMSSGLPVIASDVVGNRELVKNDITGILFSLDDVRSLADAIIDLARNTEKRKKMGDEAKKRAEKIFSLEQMAIRYSDLYLEEASKCLKS